MFSFGTGRERQFCGTNKQNTLYKYFADCMPTWQKLSLVKHRRPQLIMIFFKRSPLFLQGGILLCPAHLDITRKSWFGQAPEVSTYAIPQINKCHFWHKNIM